jgi:hypothetical protein
MDFILRMILFSAISIKFVKILRTPRTAESGPKKARGSWSTARLSGLHKMTQQLVKKTH